MSKIIPAHDPWGYILNDAMNHTSVTFLNELTGPHFTGLFSLHAGSRWRGKSAHLL